MAAAENYAKYAEQGARFVTCLADLVRPAVGFAAVTLLEAAGYRVVVPPAQTCCGQPNFNGGDRAGAQAIARRNIDMLLAYEQIVLPSGSCAGMIKRDYPLLLAGDDIYADRARTLAGRVWELASFLVEVAGYHPPPRELGRVTYHDACAGLRELGIKSQPRQLLIEAGADLVESNQAEVCCGFGGTFCVKYPDISNNMVSRKMADAVSTGAPCLVAGDLGCILNMEGKAHRDGMDIEVIHFAELLTRSER